MQEGQDQNQAGWVYSPDGNVTAPSQYGQQAQQPQQPQVQQPQAAQTQAWEPEQNALHVAHDAESPAPPAPEQTSEASQTEINEPAGNYQEQYQAPAQEAPPAPYQAPMQDEMQQPDLQTVEDVPGPEYQQQPSYQEQQPEEPPHHHLDESVRWSASEYTAGQKNSGWFTLLALSAVLVGGIIYFVTRDIFSVVVVGVLCLALGMFAAKQPKTREYAISDEGVQIGPKLYSFDIFKSFSVLHEDEVGFISLLPTKRFMPPMAMYYSPEQEDKIVDAIGEFLPYEERDHDLVDRISRKIRF